jgi:hypothetical protein
MDRHRGQAAVLKQTSELIQTNESQRKQRQRVQRFPATGSEDRIISVRIMGASRGEFQRKNHTPGASRGAVKNAVLSMLTGKTKKAVNHRLCCTNARQSCFHSVAINSCETIEHKGKFPQAERESRAATRAVAVFRGKIPRLGNRTGVRSANFPYVICKRPQPPQVSDHFAVHPSGLTLLAYALGGTLA